MLLKKKNIIRILYLHIPLDRLGYQSNLVLCQYAVAMDLEKQVALLTPMVTVPCNYYPGYCGVVAVDQIRGGLNE